MKTIQITNLSTGEKVDVPINFEGEFSNTGNIIRWKDADGNVQVITTRETKEEIIRKKNSIHNNG